MPPRDRLADLGPQLAPLLAPGETLRDAAKVSLTLGEDQVEDAARAASWKEFGAELSEKTQRQGPPPTGVRKLLGKLTGGALDFASGGSPVPGTAPDLPNPNGKALIGFDGSMAVRLRDLLKGDAGRLLAVTDRRLFVLGDPHGDVERNSAERDGRPSPPFDVLSEIPATAVRAVVRRPIQLSRGRMEITFTDGSMLAVDTGKAALADRFAAAAPRAPQA